MQKSEDSNFDFEKMTEEKYGGEVDLCYGDYNEKGVVNTKMAVH